MLFIEITNILIDLQILVLFANSIGMIFGKLVTVTALKILLCILYMKYLYCDICRW